MIKNIENGMELALVRKILNEIIARVNELEKISNSYDDLEHRPAIDGVTLTEKTSFEDFRIPVSSLDNYEEFQSQIEKTAETVAGRASERYMKTKLDCDFTNLPSKKYELEESMLLAIDSGKGEIFKTTLGDLLLFLKYFSNKS